VHNKVKLGKWTHKKNNAKQQLPFATKMNLVALENLHKTIVLKLE
jgi:hypothetical protein